MRQPNLPHYHVRRRGYICRICRTDRIAAFASLVESTTLVTFAALSVNFIISIPCVFIIFGLSLIHKVLINDIMEKSKSLSAVYPSEHLAISA